MEFVFLVPRCRGVGRGTWDVLPAAGTGRQDLISVEAPHVAVEFRRWTCPGRGRRAGGVGSCLPRRRGADGLVPVFALHQSWVELSWRRGAGEQRIPDDS